MDLRNLLPGASDQEIDYLVAKFGESWVARLSSYFSHDFWSLNEQIRLAYEEPGVKVYPAREDIYRAYKLTPPETIRVVILGQDPYPDSNANGLAFSCKYTLSLSLDYIFKAIRFYSGRKDYDFSKINLERWAEQGVFLLNTSLITKVDSSTSKVLPTNTSFKGLINKTLNICMENNAIFLLWGKYAANYATTIEAEGCKVLTAVHPASVKHFATGVPKFWPCNHFEIVNNILERRHLDSNNPEPFKKIIW